MKRSLISTTVSPNIQLELTPQGIAFLSGTTKGTPNFAIYGELLSTIATSVQIINKRGINITLSPGQTDASANLLYSKFNLGRKVMTRLLKEMETLHLIQLHTSKLCTIADMLSVTGWIDADCSFIHNPLFHSPCQNEDVDVTEEQQIPSEQSQLSEPSITKDSNDFATKDATNIASTMASVSDLTTTLTTDTPHVPELLSRLSESSPSIPQKPQVSLFHKVHSKNKQNHNKHKRGR